MTQENELANISISVNEKGQFVFNIRGENEASRDFAYSIVAYARNSLNRNHAFKNKMVFFGENPELPH